jgi:mono/diheme cytochrome c family protein
MKKRIISLISFLLLFALAGVFLAACGSSSTAPASSGGSTADGQTLMQQRCTVCHSAGRITSAQKTATEWKQTVDKMINNGAKLSPPEEQTLVNYLAQTYHP